MNTMQGHVLLVAKPTGHVEVVPSGSKAARAAVTLTASALSSCSFFSLESKAAMLASESCSSIAHTIKGQ